MKYSAALLLALTTLISPGTAQAVSHAATAGTAPAAASNDLTVDLAAPTGQFRGGASGSLYGIASQDVPSNNLIEGMGLQTTDTKAQDGQQHPGSDALEIAKPFLASGGRDVLIYMTDVYRDFPYERASYPEYQGYLKTQVEQAMNSPYASHIVLVPYNEPDGNWFGGLVGNPARLAAFEDEWLQTYRFIKGLWPQARLAGPNFFAYHPAEMKGFLQFCQQHDCLPDLVTWHELSVPSTVRPDVAAYRALETSLGIAHLPVSLNEYAARYQLTDPAEMTGYLSAIEDSKVDGDLPYWNINGTLSDSASQNNIPNAQWWLYHWYAGLTGNTVKVTAPQGNTDNTLQGLATLDQRTRQARVIFGGGAAGQDNLVVQHVDPAVFGGTAHVTLLRDNWSGMNGPAPQPTRVLDKDMPVGSDGSITLPVDNPGPAGDIADCTATGARVAGKLGSALKLCGNHEYVNLPNGIVSGLHDFTVSAWVNPSANSAWSRLFDFGSGTGDYMFLTMSAGGGPLRFAITAPGSGGEQQITSSAGTLPLNTWSHVAVTLSGTTGTLYVNGQPVGTNTNMTLNPAALGSTNQDWIGRSQFSADPYLAATVDDFQIYSRALSASEVAGLAGGQPGSGDVADYKFDETSGATATDSSGNGRDGTIISQPVAPSTTTAYEAIISPGGTGSDTPADATWRSSYEAENATLTGSGWNINTEGTPGNLGGFATSNNQDVGGLRTGSSSVITFHVNVPQAGDYRVSVFDGSNCRASDVNGPTNVFLRADGGSPQQVWLPCSYNWPVWNIGNSTVHLSAGRHDLSLSTTGANGAATSGDAIIDKIDLQLVDPAVQDHTVYEAEQAALNGATADYRSQGQSGAGAADIGRGQSAAFWVYAARDGYSDLAFRTRNPGAATITVNGLPVTPDLTGSAAGWESHTDRVYLTSGINKVVVTGAGGQLTLDKLTVSPAQAGTSTYQAENGTLTGTAKTDNSYSQANGGVVTGISDGAANSLTFHVTAPAAGTYGMTVRYASDEGIAATHYNPDLMTAPADISVDGRPTFHFNFSNTFSWNQFSTVTIPVNLQAGDNTIKFIANQQYNWDGKTVGVIYSGDDIGSPLRSDTAPNIDQITLAPFELHGGQ
ncbi:MAG: carbohydrate-binding protein [Actinobacteria bacterium]|nr:carbohydrate-binding protein [Actinomycetota bacterium]